MSIDSSYDRDRMDGDDELPSEWDSAVQRVRAASRIVQPSELLRTKILQRARQREGDVRSDRMVLRSVMAFALLSVFFLFAGSKMEAWREERVHRATWAGMQERAAEIASERKLAMDASLDEAYVEWRFELAQRWRNPTAHQPSQPGNR
ncbi:MAG: hypothetical protein ACK6DC_20435 [Planctomycetota bacterium]|jgi:hypothetical protein